MGNLEVCLEEDNIALWDFHNKSKEEIDKFIMKFSIKHKEYLENSDINILENKIVKIKKIKKIIEKELILDNINLWEEYNSISNTVLDELIIKYSTKHNYIDKKDISFALERIHSDIEKTCERYYPKAQDLNVSIVSILEELVENNNSFISHDNLKKVIEKQSSEVDDSDNIYDISNMTNRACKNIFCFMMADFNRISERKSEYKLDKEKYFEEVFYSLDDNEVLKSLFPIMVAYIKSQRGIYVADFFRMLSELIKYFLRPIETFSTNILNNLIKYIEKEKYTSITFKDLKSKNGVNSHKDVLPLKISLNNKREIILEFELDEIKKSIKVEDILNLDYTKSFDNTTLSKLSIIKEENEFNYKNKKTEKIVLECRIDTYGYFHKGVFESQKIYATENELLEFKEIHNIKIKDNCFYVVANENKDTASSVILKCMPKVRVLSPTSLNTFINEKIQKYNSLSSSS